METSNIFTDFLGKEVKVPYKDGTQFSIAKGILESMTDEFIKIRGRLGVIIINQKNIEKMSLVSTR